MTQMTLLVRRMEVTKTLNVMKPTTSTFKEVNGGHRPKMRHLTSGRTCSGIQFQWENKIRQIYKADDLVGANQRFSSRVYVDFASAEVAF